MDAAMARKELSDLYPGIEKAEYFADYIEISAALGSGPASTPLIAGLKALEAAMTDRIVANAGASDETRELLVTRALKGWDKRRGVYDEYNREKSPKPEKIET